MKKLNRFSVRKIQNKLSASNSDVKYDKEHLRQAAVLMPLFYMQQEWHLLFIRRASHEQDHYAGQVAFAGGKWESGDADLVATALREAEEEIALSSDCLEVLGHLPGHNTADRFMITPVIAVIPWPCLLKAAPDEVARIFSIPLEWLSDKRHYQLKNIQKENGRVEKILYFEEYDGELLWGVTARMVLSLTNLLETV